ncbi:magnesium transporter MgtE N-terminal domain-containing protein [Propionibacteriaceae bacterium Y1700]|uniref:magnesium transporter MgtE N-terminal domain-containing protein n=1 Tax=Microlunatus sp. Y1700 TaxID=3418487 RepID=UPI003DA77D0C
MSSPSHSVFISRIKGLPVLDAGGDEVARVRDVVLAMRTAGRAPRVKGLVVQLFARQRVFLPMARVRHVDGAQVTISGVVNTRKFIQRDTETLVLADLVDRTVQRAGESTPLMVFDVAMKEVRAWEWELSEVAVRERGTRFGRRGHVMILDWAEVPTLTPTQHQGTEQLIAQMEDMHAADVAKELHDLTPARRAEVIAALDDAMLADALGELPDEDQLDVMAQLDLERAADVLEEMDPDDAADLINELPTERAEELLGRMEPEEAEDVRRLMTYEDLTAGGLMTPEPVIVAHDATVAEALALVRQEEITPALAAMIFVCRTPLETPTGRFLGGVHIQRLLREPPSTLVSTLIDSELEPLREEATLHQVARFFAVYNLVTAPVVDKERRLTGAITVDDVLDNVLPDDWRDEQLDETDPDDSDSADHDTVDEVSHG